MTLFRPDLAAFGLGGGELMIILVIILVLFGGAKLPSLARGLGQSIKEFKKASKEEDPEKPEAKVGEEKKSEPANTPGAH
jgi:sec-independent protein translocase protein TatA